MKARILRTRDRLNIVLTRLPLSPSRAYTAYLAAALILAAAFALRLAIDHSLPPGYPFITFFLAIVAITILFGLRLGIIASVLGYLLAHSFFIVKPGGPWFNFSAAMAMVLYFIVTSIDVAAIHLMQRAYHRLWIEREKSRRLAENRELLFRELQHRVGNNLQMVSALLDLEKRNLIDPAAREALDSASRRLLLVGKIQRNLYDPDGAQVELHSFLERICLDIITAAGPGAISYEVKVATQARLVPSAAIPTALIVAEAVANAIEHGFAGRSTGTIKIEAADAGEKLSITIADDGHGLAADFDPSVSPSLGLRIARKLALTLGGSFSIAAGSPGAIATLLVKV